MHSIANFFRLVRWPNLLIVFLTQLLIWACVIRPAGEVLGGAGPFLHTVHFILLSLTTVLIAAAGYVINDYYDRDIDRINKPGKVIAGRIFSVRQTLWFYAMLNLTALLLSAYLSFSLKMVALAAVQLFCVLLLWLYAAALKARPVWGNVVVALLTTLTILILVAYEPLMYRYGRSPVVVARYPHRLINPLWVIGVYAFFAFMTTWMREIVKDMQDVRGDAAVGCRTLPIVASLQVAARLVVLLGIATILALAGVALSLMWWERTVLSVYLLLALVLPVLALIMRIGRHHTPEHYGKWSGRLKAIMLAGIAALPLYYLLTFAL
ncbi:MAG TPA: geranylgeranylglycerol-phosphate geranylgeranyltransferase [Edaphocola sp.]|nr:geranylgeranylglycerol-phosphate geranylgeranyltransferase [Edaphocola sp.]